MEFLFSHGILANQNFTMSSAVAAETFFGGKESVRNSIAELLLNPFAVDKVCSCMILGIL